MTCLSTMSAAAPVKPVRRIDSNSTVYSEHSDITTESNCSSRLPSPRQTCDREQCNVIVKATFLDVDEGQSLLQCFAQLRGRIISDSALVMGFGGFDIEAYEPGKFSDEHAKSAESTCAGPNMPEVREEPKDTQASLQPKSQASQASQAAGKKKSQSKQTADRTTVMLRNVPNNYTREMFLTLLDDHGFAGRYDFVYLPCDFKRQANLGYAFVNLVDASAVDAAWATFEGFEAWALPSQKVCQVKWSGPHQGLEAHVERYKNSPVMHKCVPDEYKPVIFADGVRRSFPRPTKKVKAPNM
ncbi:TE1 [Symbiodinium natans]|uniref:TE1 protein n=1 Tax=Symbiodinium natans TaxID=878477 RepID=A0A812QAN2_9DINO|nr:TE1 [Symbiodinium natans]